MSIILILMLRREYEALRIEGKNTVGLDLVMVIYFRLIPFQGPPDFTPSTSFASFTWIFRSAIPFSRIHSFIPTHNQLRFNLFNRAENSEYGALGPKTSSLMPKVHRGSSRSWQKCCSSILLTGEFSGELESQTRKWGRSSIPKGVSPGVSIFSIIFNMLCYLFVFCRICMPSFTIPS